MAPFFNETSKVETPLSSLATTIKASSAEASRDFSPQLHHLAAQVQHNLKYQHDWSSLKVHTHSPLSSSALLSRPILSGIPPQRIYIHPDEQAEMLRHGLTEADLEPVKEWVLPTHLKEKWSLRKFAEVFDNIGATPPAGGEQHRSSGVDDPRKNKYTARERDKRLLLATVNGDSTIVYYIIHDGIVKPRQN